MPRITRRLPVVTAAAVITATIVLLAACTGDDRTPLVVYSPHGRDLLERFENRFEEAHPDVDVQWLDMGSQEVLDRLRSERANPQADVWWGAPSPMFETAAGAGLLAAYTPSWADALSAEMRDGDGYWHATYLTPEVIAYNSEAVPADEAPRDWDEVLDPRWADQVLIRDPLASGTMRAIFGMMVQRSLRETGDTASGFDWLRRLDAHTKEYVLNPTLLYQKLARQEGLITLWTLPDIEMVRSRQGLPVGYVLPESGTPVVIDPIAVVDGAPQPELAREFIEFVGDQENVLLAVEEFYRVPARTDLPDERLPEWLRDALPRMVMEPMDWNAFQQQSSAWMSHWDGHVRGRGGR